MNGFVHDALAALESAGIPCYVAIMAANTAGHVVASLTWENPGLMVDGQPVAPFHSRPVAGPSANDVVRAAVEVAVRDMLTDEHVPENARAAIVALLRTPTGIVV